MQTLIKIEILRGGGGFLGSRCVGGGWVGLRTNDQDRLFDFQSRVSVDVMCYVNICLNPPNDVCDGW